MILSLIIQYKWQAAKGIAKGCGASKVPIYLKPVGMGKWLPLSLDAIINF